MSGERNALNSEFKLPTRSAPKRRRVSKKHHNRIWSVDRGSIEGELSSGPLDRYVSHGLKQSASIPVASSKKEMLRLIFDVPLRSPHTEAILLL